MKKLGVVFILLSILSLISGCSYYSKGPWRGRVIDADTKKPIEGAAVVAVWQVGHPSIPEYRVEPYEAKETLTDKNGYYEIPKFSRITFATNEIWDPTFTIFKPGYGRFPPSIGGVSKEAKGGKTPDGGLEFSLPKLESIDDRWKNLSGLLIDGGSLDNAIPQFLKLKHEEENILIQKKGEKK